MWCDNAKHFKNKVLLSFFADLTRLRIFTSISLCFFEAYHGKSLVDGMFGTMTQWLTEWKKSHYINTTQDLLICFQQNNMFLPHPHLNFFYELSLDTKYWTEMQHSEIQRIKLKNMYFFEFKCNSNFYTAYTLDFTLNRTTNKIEFHKLISYKKPVIQKQKKISKKVKFSEAVEAINVKEISLADETFLKKKAKAWGLPY